MTPIAVIGLNSAVLKKYIFESNITTHYASTTYNITYTPDYYELLRQDSCKIFYEC